MKNKVWLIVACVFAAVMVLAAVLYPNLRTIKFPMLLFRRMISRFTIHK